VADPVPSVRDIEDLAENFESSALQPELSREANIGLPGRSASPGIASNEGRTIRCADAVEIVVPASRDVVGKRGPRGEHAGRSSGNSAVTFAAKRCRESFAPGPRSAA